MTFQPAPKGPATKILNRLVDFLLPPRCGGCGRMLESSGHFCATCFGALELFSGTVCYQCAMPVETGFWEDEDPDIQCAACASDSPAFDRMCCIGPYSGRLREVILRLKYGGTDAAAPLSRILLQAAQPLLEETQIDLLVPVPLHWRRRLTRRYNQTELLGRRVAAVTKLPYMPELLQRRRATRSQGGLSRRARRKNVRSAFSVAEHQKPALAGRTVLLLDDVITTGATADACARVLKKAGARRVYVLGLARATGMPAVATEY